VIFVDTSFWAALLIPRDRHHREARELLRAVANEPLVTSNHVRGETWTFLRRRAGHPVALAFLDRQRRSKQLEVVWTTAQVEGRALAWLRDHDEREYSFVDATSFALMRSLKVRRALAFDGDFTAAGFEELRR
jgi:predicted nucleic acid-binding protein